MHLWGGLILGIYALLIGLTGSVLVFHEEIAHRMSPKPRVAPPVDQPSLENIRAGIQAAKPEWHPWSLEMPSEPGEPWASYLLKQGGGGMMVYAASDGRLAGEDRTHGTWLDTVEKFHGSLLIPKGRLYNGIAGLALVALALTGFYLWWPERGQWHSAFKIVRYANWKGLNYDLHRVGGALTLGFIVLSGITGAYFTWGPVYKQIAASILPAKPVQKVPPVVTTGARLPVDDLVASAQRVLPGTTLVRVLVPRGGGQAVTVVFAHGDTAAARRRRTSQVSVNPHTGEVLAVDDYRQRQLADHVISWMGPLHTGHFGGWPVKATWAVLGLSLPALFITGFLMWCNRVLAPRLRVARKPAAETVS